MSEWKPKQGGRNSAAEQTKATAERTTYLHGCGVHASYYYIQFILHGWLVPKCNIMGKRGAGGDLLRCHRLVHVWCVQLKALCIGADAEMCWLLRGRDIDNWGLPAMLRPVVSLFWVNVSVGCALCRLRTEEPAVMTAKHWKCIWVSPNFLRCRAACHPQLLKMNIWSSLLQKLSILQSKVYSLATNFPKLWLTMLM